MYPIPYHELSGWNIRSLTCGSSTFACAATYGNEKSTITWGHSNGYRWVRQGGCVGIWGDEGWAKGARRWVGGGGWTGQFGAAWGRVGGREAGEKSTITWGHSNGYRWAGVGVPCCHSGFVQYSEGK